MSAGEKINQKLPKITKDAQSNIYILVLLAGKPQHRERIITLPKVMRDRANRPNAGTCHSMYELVMVHITVRNTGEH